MNNQRIANLHYVLDELDRLYTAIQNGILLDPNQSRKQLIESYQSQRSQFMDILSFILPPISSPNTSMMSMLPSITTANASMFPSCIEQPVESDQDEINNQINDNGDGQNAETTNTNNINGNMVENGTELNPESHEFVPAFGAPTIDTIGPLQAIMPTQSLPSITSALSVPSIHSAQSLPSIHSDTTINLNNYLPNINDLSNNNNNYLTEPGRHSMDILEHQQSITTTVSSGFASPTTNIFETNVNNNNNGNSMNNMNNLNFNNNQFNNDMNNSGKMDTNSSYQPSVIDTNSNEQYNEYEYSDSDEDDENNININNGTLNNNNINYHGQGQDNMNNMNNQNNGDNQIYDQIQQQQTQSLQFQDNNNHIQFKYANNNNRPEKLSKKLASLRPDPPEQPDYGHDDENGTNYNNNGSPLDIYNIYRHNKNNNHHHHHRNHRKNQHKNYHKPGHHHLRHNKNQRNNYNQHHRGTYYKKRQQVDDNNNSQQHDNNRNEMNEEQKYDYDYDDEDEDYNDNDNQSQRIDENDPLLGSSPFPHNEIQPGQQIIVPLKPKISHKPPTVIDLDPSSIEASKVEHIPFLYISIPSTYLCLSSLSLTLFLNICICFNHKNLENND